MLHSIHFAVGCFVNLGSSILFFFIGFYVRIVIKFHFRWFAKRFLNPAVVSVYDYIFLWDEDLGVKNFHPGRYQYSAC